jgi:3-hydroxybutyryl-CoA dehydratase
MHINEEFADTTIFEDRIAHGLLTGSFISTVLGMKLPGPNSIYLSQSFSFTAPVKIGDTITAKVEVIEKQDEKKFIKLKTQVWNQHKKMVVDGEALVMKKYLNNKK